MANIRVHNLGNIYPTNEGYFVELVSIIKDGLFEVKFTSNDCKVIVSRSNLTRGSVANPMHPSVCGVAYFGVGEHKAWIEGKHTEEYECWKSMISRVYKNTINKNKTYKDVIVCDEWLNFQNFAKWYNENYPHHIKDIKFQLDKDLLNSDSTQKIYSPDRCLFLPPKINSYISKVGGVGAYKNWNKYECGGNEFGSNKHTYLGLFSTEEAAIGIYKAFKTKQDESAKDYLRSLNYLPEEIIQLIKTV